MENFKMGNFCGKPKIKKSGDKWIVFGFHTKYFYLEDSWQEAIEKVKSIYRMKVALR